MMRILLYLRTCSLGQFEELRYRPKSIPAKPREPQLATAARARPPK
jgi:hypothetical protein